MGPGAMGAGPALGMTAPDDFGPPEDGPWASDDD